MTESALNALQEAYEARQSSYVLEYCGKCVLDIKKSFALNEWVYLTLSRMPSGTAQLYG